jgi:hypothetical protein
VGVLQQNLLDIYECPTYPAGVQLDDISTRDLFLKQLYYKPIEDDSVSCGRAHCTCAVVRVIEVIVVVMMVEVMGRGEIECTEKDG